MAWLLPKGSTERGGTRKALEAASLGLTCHRLVYLRGKVGGRRKGEAPVEVLRRRPDADSGAGVPVSEGPLVLHKEHFSEAARAGDALGPFDVRPDGVEAETVVGLEPCPGPEDSYQATSSSRGTFPLGSGEGALSVRI